MQPKGSYRFALDALLLAAFLDASPGDRLLELGTGCGAVALGMLCRYPDLIATGIDVQECLVEAARHNAAMLGFSSFSALCADIGNPALFARTGGDEDRRQDGLPLPAASWDVALANPPYRKRTRGRLPMSPSRLLALFEQEDTLPVFCRVAAQALRPKGRFAVIYPASRQEELLRSLEKEGLFAARLLSVLPRKDGPPSLLLVEAVREEEILRRPPTMLPPLVLHEGRGKNTRFTQEAMDFCPFVTCNPGMGGM